MHLMTHIDYFITTDVLKQIPYDKYKHKVSLSNA